MAISGGGEGRLIEERELGRQLRRLKKSLTPPLKHRPPLESPLAETGSPSEQTLVLIGGGCRKWMFQTLAVAAPSRLETSLLPVS